MRLHPLSVIVPLLVAVVALGLVAFDRSAAGFCKEADQSLKGDLLHQAQKSYAALLADEPDSGCANAGMRTTLVRLCHRGDDLRASDASDEARKVYVAVLEADPAGEGHRCARMGLRELASAAADATEKEPEQCCQACPTGAAAGPGQTKDGQGDDGQGSSRANPWKGNHRACRLSR